MQAEGADGQLQFSCYCPVKEELALKDPRVMVDLMVAVCN